MKPRAPTRCRRLSSYDDPLPHLFVRHYIAEPGQEGPFVNTKGTAASDCQRSFGGPGSRRVLRPFPAMNRHSPVLSERLRSATWRTFAESTLLKLVWVLRPAWDCRDFSYSRDSHNRMNSNHVLRIRDVLLGLLGKISLRIVSFFYTP